MNTASENRLYPGIVYHQAVHNCAHCPCRSHIACSCLRFVDHERRVWRNDPFLGSKVRGCGGATYVTTVVGQNLYWKRLEVIEEEHSLVDVSSRRLNEEMHS